MKMKLYCLRFVAMAVLCGASVASVFADDQLVVTGPSGTLAQVGLSDIDKITFSGDNITIATSEGDKVYGLSEIDKISFDASLAAIDRVEESLGDISVGVSYGVFTASGPAGMALAVSVYDMRGVLIASRQGSESVSIDFNDMPSGVYIVKANNKIIKFTR